MCLDVNGDITMHTYLQDRGRIVIPAEIRKRLNIQKGELIYFTETKSGIMITINKHYNFERRQEKDENIPVNLLIEEEENNEIKLEWNDEDLEYTINYES